MCTTRIFGGMPPYQYKCVWLNNEVTMTCYGAGKDNLLNAEVGGSLLPGPE
jgi:hypothetical protein